MFKHKKFLSLVSGICFVAVTTTIAYAVWHSVLRSPAVLGTAEVKLQYADNSEGPWTDEMPPIFNEPEFNKSGAVIREFWLKSVGADPAGHSLCILADGEIIQGTNEQGAIVGDDIRKYFSVESYIKDSVELKPDIVDQDLDGEKTLFDLAEQTIESPDSCVGFGSNEAHKIKITLQAYSSMLNVDDLHGDGWNGDLIFILR